MSKKEKDLKKIQEFVERFRKLDDKALTEGVGTVVFPNGLAKEAINIVLKERKLK